MARLFGTDGIRGASDGTSRSSSRARWVERRSARSVVSTIRSPTLPIGRDTRLSGKPPRTHSSRGSSMRAAMSSWAGRPHPCRGVPRPRARDRVRDVISASHNQPGDNGIKFFDAGGYKLSDRLEGQIEDEIGAGGGAARTEVRPSRRMPPATRPRGSGSPTGRWTGWIVVDCANGAASGFAPDRAPQARGRRRGDQRRRGRVRINVGSAHCSPRRSPKPWWSWR